MANDKNKSETDKDNVKKKPKDKDAKPKKDRKNTGSKKKQHDVKEKVGDDVQEDAKSEQDQDEEGQSEPEVDVEDMEEKRPNFFRTEKGDEYYVQKIKLPFLVHLAYLMSPFWEWFVMVQVFITYFCITYIISFALFIQHFYDATWWLDILFAADTAARVIVEIWRYKAEVPCVVFLVPYSFFQFCLDVLSLIPIERIFLLTVNVDQFSALMFFDYWRMNRFLRFSRVFKFFNVAVNEHRVSEMLMFIVRYMTQYLMFLQFVACFFFFILPAYPIDFMLQRRTKELGGSWIRTVASEKPSYGKEHFDHYSLAISFAACVLTTTGYGDFSGTTSVEMLIMSLVMLIGAIIISGFFSSGLAAFKLEHDGARFDLFYRVGAITNHLTHIKAHEIYINKVVEYYQLLWNYREGVYDVTFMAELPRPVVEDMFYDICREMFHKSPLFRGLDETFLRAVSGIVHVVIYNPDMILCSTGGYAMNMFYLLQGECRIKSKLDKRCTSGILRAGCIIGEMNLFFSYPYTTTLETRTCCQLLQIQKFELFELFGTHTEMLHILRDRVERRLRYTQKQYEMKGKEPVCWVEKRKQPKHEPTESDVEFEFPTVIRSGRGLNRIVTKDVIDDTQDTHIIDMPCIDPSYAKQHTRVFKTCVIPPILSAADTWVRWWNMAIMMFTLYSAVMAPYCMHFRSTNELGRFLCRVDSKVEVIFCFVYMGDVLVEICYSCPVSGLYYKFHDGIRLRITELTFWIDIASAIPLALFDVFRVEGFRLVVTAIRILRLWKVMRYFEYLDNVHPDSLFSFRLIQALASIIYFTHIVACFLYGMACQPIPDTDKVVCQPSTWLRSFTEGKTGFAADVRHDILGNTAGYWVSFYFACATVTSTGFGDFNPQTRREMIFLAAVQFLSFCITGYFTALLTSALSCTVRPKLAFQQKLIGVRQFLEHKGLAEPLQKRIIEHYYLQDQLWSGVNLPENVNHYMFDTPEYLHEDALYLEVELHFEGVPIFTKLDPAILVGITKLMRRYLIPPGAIFVRKGEVRRQMYVIGRGSVAFMSDKDKDTPSKILDETGHFGLRDLLFGEPAHHDVKTMSYCLLYEVELRDLFEALRSDIDLLAIVEEEKVKLQPGIDAMIQEYSLSSSGAMNEPAQEIPNFIHFPTHPNHIMKGSTWEEYEEVFNAMRRPFIYRVLLMRRTIHPAGSFAKFWTSFMSLIAAITIATLVAETFSSRRGLETQAVFIFTNFVNWIDIYLKLHWAYYTEKNMLISHPVKTAIRYVFKGEFVYDMLITMPYELIIPIVTGTNFFGYAKTAGWFSKFRWTRFGQIIRIPAVIKIFHNIFKMRNVLLLMCYVTVTLITCTVIASIAESFACPSGQSIYQPGDENKLPFCRKDTYIQNKASNGLHSLWERWVIGTYYASQTMFSVGYGDMTTLAVEEMKLLIVVSLFGFAIVRYILADITAAEVDIDEVRHRYHEGIIRVQLTMAREQVPKKLQKYVLQHALHTWDMSKGLQPRQLFRDLHPALEADLFRDLVGNDLKKVPIFLGFRENILRTICQYMNTLFFRKGERITRFGNMEREMFIIVHGHIWIADRHLIWTNTLSAGESFGEVSVVYGTRRTYSAIASSDVELFVLSNEDFYYVLQRYPAVLDDLKDKLKDENLDIFQIEAKKSKMRMQSDELESISHQIKTLLEKNTVPDPIEDEIFQHIRVGWFNQFLTGLAGVGIEDQNLPFFYFTKNRCRYWRRFPPYLIHPKCTFMNWFQSLIIFISYVSPALAAYNISFAEEMPSRIDDTILMVTWLLEIPMYCHILLEFLTPFQLPDGGFCKDFRRIAFNYVTTFSRFGFDVISSIPLDTPGPHSSRLLKNAYAIRFLRLAYFYRTQLAKASDLSTSTIRYKITLSMSVFMLMTHWIACIFYSMAACSCSHANKTICNDDDVPFMCREGTWTHEFIRSHEVFYIRRLETWRWYIRCNYWIITTVSTTGFGDITPVNTHETLVAILTIFCGAFIISIILSHFASGIASLNKSYREYLYKVNLLLKHMGNIGMSQERRDEVMSYFVMRWDRCRGLKYHESTAILPSNMDTTVCYFLYSNVAIKNKLFSHGLDTIFMRQLCSLFTHSLYISGINVVNEGFLESVENGEGGNENIGTTYLIFKGRISSYGVDEKGRQILVKTYCVGDLFAQYSTFFFDMPYNKTYRAETHVEVLGITQPQVIELVSQFPQFAENVRSLMKSEFSEVKQFRNIFDGRADAEEDLKDVDPEVDESLLNFGSESVNLNLSGGGRHRRESAKARWSLLQEQDEKNNTS